MKRNWKALAPLSCRDLLCIFISIRVGSPKKSDRHGRALTYASTPIVLAAIRLLGSSFGRVWPTTAFPFSIVRWIFGPSRKPIRRLSDQSEPFRSGSVGSAGRVQSDQASLSVVTATEQEVRTQNGFHGRIVGWGCITPWHRATGKLFNVGSDLHFLHNVESSYACPTARLRLRVGGGATVAARIDSGAGVRSDVLLGSCFIPSIPATAIPIARPRRGGTALPICFTICDRVPQNSKSSSKDCSRAPSRGVKPRSAMGWIHRFEAGWTKFTVIVTLGSSAVSRE